MNLGPPHQGWKTGGVLLASLTVNRTDAERCQAYFKVEGITKEFEPLGFRIAGQFADYRGAAYQAYRIVNLHPYELSELWVCVAPEDRIWRVFPWVEELGGFDAYRLEKSKTYEARFKIIGNNFKPKEWVFSLAIDSDNGLSFTNPKVI